MRMIPRAVIGFFCIIWAFTWIACQKSGDDKRPGSYQLGYGDSILYLKAQAGDYIVAPTEVREGLYEGFPEGIEIDDRTGAINVSKSETGLRYRITHTAPDGTVTTTLVVLSGITFTDKYYNLSQNDSVAFPVYNALSSRPLPLAGSVFDEDGGAHASGCNVQTVNGRINLTQSIRDGLFGSHPKHDDKRDIDIVYRLNDGSNKTVNKLRVRLYYYTSMATVDPTLLKTLKERQDDGVFLRTAVSTADMGRGAKPRPPCVVIIAN